MNTWSQIGETLPHASRREIRERLESAGLDLNTAAYRDAYEAFRRGMEAALAARQAEADARERKRIEPYLAGAREAVMSWGCVEDGEFDAAQIEESVIEEATRLADDAEEAEAEAARAAKREAEELADYEGRQDGLRRAVEAAHDAAAAAGWRLEKRRCSHDSSRYYWAKIGGDPADPGDYDDVFSLRISDHHAKNGSGWNEAAQTQYDRPDVNVVLRRGESGEYEFNLTKLLEELDR